MEPVKTIWVFNAEGMPLVQRTCGQSQAEETAKTLQSLTGGAYYKMWNLEDGKLFSSTEQVRA